MFRFPTPQIKISAVQKSLKSETKPLCTVISWKLKELVTSQLQVSKTTRGRVIPALVTSLKCSSSLLKPYCLFRYRAHPERLRFASNSSPVSAFLLVSTKNANSCRPDSGSPLFTGFRSFCTGSAFARSILIGGKSHKRAMHMLQKLGMARVRDLGANQKKSRLWGRDWVCISLYVKIGNPSDYDELKLQNIGRKFCE